MIERGVQVRNQTVLLRGVNDSGEVLGKLLGKLTRVGIAPYYIFQCRPVTGVKERLWKRVPGAAMSYAVQLAVQPGIRRLQDPGEGPRHVGVVLALVELEYRFPVGEAAHDLDLPSGVAHGVAHRLAKAILPGLGRVHDADALLDGWCQIFCGGRCFWKIL